MMLELEDQLAADTAARIKALTALDRTLLVEAGAGSGTTSVLAGGLPACWQLDATLGRSPASPSPNSPLENCASECALSSPSWRAAMCGRTSRQLFRSHPNETQRRALSHAASEMDELVCTTIHGFCQRLLTPYPVEACMGPGAAVMDRGAADALFVEVLDSWLHDRLSGNHQQGDLLLTLYAESPAATDKLLRGIAEAMRSHRGATVPDTPSRADALAELRAAALKLKLPRFRGVLRDLVQVGSAVAASLAAS